MVFDLDGVLSDAGVRQHLISGWDLDAFFDACGDDPLLDDVARLLDVIDPELHVVLLSARPARVEPQTRAWLERHGIRWDLLVLRPAHVPIGAARFKRAVVDELRAIGLDPVLAFEDDRRNVEAFKSAGVPCVYIHSGYYDGPPGG